MTPPGFDQGNVTMKLATNYHAGPHRSIVLSVDAQDKVAWSARYNVDHGDGALDGDVRDAFAALGLPPPTRAGGFHRETTDC